METKKNLIARVAKKVAENALRRDANSTTCVCIYQPKIPEKLNIIIHRIAGAIRCIQVA